MEENLEFRCPNCGKVFDSYGGLKIHLGMNHLLDTQDEECPYCGETFTQRAGVLGHIRREHQNKLIYACSICGKTFDSLRGLRTHISMSHKEIWREIKNRNKGIKGVKGKILPEDVYLNIKEEMNKNV